MTGSGVGITERDRQVIAEVHRFGALTRQQLQQLGFFRSSTRAKARLKQLVDGRYLQVRRQPLSAGGPRCVYLPLLTRTETGRRLKNVSDFFLAHQLGLVDIRIAFEAVGRIAVWASDRELTDRKLGVVPDAYVEFDIDGRTVSAFVEYDRGTESVGRIEGKVRSYLDLAYSGRFAQTFRRKFFRVLVVTDAIGRLQTLATAAAKHTDRVFRFALLSELQRHGPLASIWRRPGAKTSQPLIET